MKGLATPGVHGVKLGGLFFCGLQPLSIYSVVNQPHILTENPQYFAPLQKWVVSVLDHVFMHSRSFCVVLMVPKIPCCFPILHLHFVTRMLPVSIVIDKFPISIVIDHVIFGHLCIVFDRPLVRIQLGRVSPM